MTNPASAATVVCLLAGVSAFTIGVFARKKRLVYFLLPSIVMLVLLTGCSVSDQPAQSEAPKAPKSVQLRLISSTNLKEWEIALSPEFNAAIDKWVFDEKIEYLGPASVQNVEVDVGDATGTRIAEEKPHQPFQSLGTWIPVDQSSFTVHVSWVEQGKQRTGQAVYAIEKQ